MTQKELREYIFNLTKTLFSKSCYIKGYGEKFRVMNKDHNLVTNISKREFRVIELNNLVRRERGMVWVLDKAANPFTHPIDVRLPIAAAD